MKHRLYTSRSIDGLIVAARLRGWTVQMTGGGHLRFTHPAGGLVFTSSTPSDWRATRKIGAELRRQEGRFRPRP